MAAFENGISKDVLYNDGEGLDYNDLNNSQRYERAYLDDLVLGSVARVTELETFGGRATDLAYARWDQGAVIPDGSANRKIKLSPGMLYIATGGSGFPDGSIAKLYGYCLTDGEVSLQYTAGDATNPRIDIVQVKIGSASAAAVSRDFKDATTGVISTQSMSVQRDTVLTASIKAGTPAGSPAAPSPDAGYIVLARIAVAATFNSTTTQGQIKDYRQPLGWTTGIVPGRHGIYTGSDYAVSLQRATASAGSKAIYYVPGHICGESFKLMRMRIGHHTAGGTFVLGAFNYAGTWTALQDISSLFTLDGTRREQLVSYFDLDSPVWSNGNYSPFSTTTLYQVGILYTSSANTDYIDYVKFDFAGGF